MAHTITTRIKSIHKLTFLQNIDNLNNKFFLRRDSSANFKIQTKSHKKGFPQSGVARSQSALRREETV